MVLVPLGGGVLEDRDHLDLQPLVCRVVLLPARNENTAAPVLASSDSASAVRNPWLVSVGLAPLLSRNCGIQGSRLRWPVQNASCLSSISHLDDLGVPTPGGRVQRCLPVLIRLVDRGAGVHKPLADGEEAAGGRMVQGSAHAILVLGTVRGPGIKQHLDDAVVSVEGSERKRRVAVRTRQVQDGLVPDL